jgi:pyruvate formate lyase activating enzyme
MKEALLWITESGKIRCNLCARACLIGPGESGYCKVRSNKKNILVTKNFGKINHLDFNKIESHNFFHFYPGSQTISVGSIGDNIDNPFVARSDQEKKDKMSPEDLVKLANDKKVKLITFTDSEPTIFFEFAYRVARLAKRYNIKTSFVTNGYITSEAVKKIGKYLDAVNVQITASGDPEFYKKYFDSANVEEIFSALKSFKKHRVFTEISNMIIPEIGDSPDMNRKLVEWIVNKLGSSIPYHLVAYSPVPKFDYPQTSLETLDALANRSFKMGMRYVYVSGVFGSDFENTTCYNCGRDIIKRVGSIFREMEINGDRCPNCGFKISLIK